MSAFSLFGGMRAAVSGLFAQSQSLGMIGDNIANVNTVAGISSNVTAVAGNATNVNAVAGAITNVNNVGGSIANVNTVASNLSGVNSFAARYRTDNSGNNPSSSLDAGDLYYNTSTNTLNYYNGSSFVAVVAGAMTSLAIDTTPQLGGNLDVNGNSIVSVSNLIEMYNNNLTISGNSNG